MTTRKKTLDKAAPVKQKYVRSNQSPFSNKQILKAIMKSTRLRNKFLRTRSAEDRFAYNQQRNFCLSLIRKAKKDYFNNLDHKKVTDNKSFWKTVKPLFSDKSSSLSKFTLIENELQLNDDENISSALNDFFSNVVSSLNIPPYKDPSVNPDQFEDPVLKANEKYKNYPSIKAIKERNINKVFKFQSISRSDIKKEILSLDSSKASQESDIPTKIIKQNVDIFTEYLFHEFEKSLFEKFEYTSLFKFADITPVHKKGSRFEKNNYRPVSILPVLSKVFEKCLYKQISSYFDNIFSKYQCGFSKGFGAQHYLIAMIEKWRDSMDKGKFFGALLTDLSKVFDCLPHDLLAAKLSAYGFDNNSTKFLFDYLTNRKQRTKIGQVYSSWDKITSGVPQGSILRPLIFNIDLIDIFYILSNYDIASYADDNTPDVTCETMQSLIESLEKIAEEIFKWFKNNEIQANTDKCHVLPSTDQKLHVNIGTLQIEYSKCEKLLGVNIDSKLSFEKHLNITCGKARAKISALGRVAPFMNIEKRKMIMNAFFNSQFSYCPLTWMFHNRLINNKINRLHERCLRKVYNDNQSTFEELLEKDNTVSVYQRNLQFLAIELYKVVNGISPDLMKEVFPLNDDSGYSAYLAPKIWELVPNEIKAVESLASFKSAIK